MYYYTRTETRSKEKDSETYSRSFLYKIHEITVRIRAMFCFLKRHLPTYRLIKLYYLKLWFHKEIFFWYELLIIRSRGTKRLNLHSTHSRWLYYLLRYTLSVERIKHNLHNHVIITNSLSWVRLCVHCSFVYNLHTVTFNRFLK